MTSDADASEPGSEFSGEVELFAAQRLIFFSDAVVAIAITLLALNLRAPSGSSNAAVWRSLTSHGTDYLAFLISFTVIATYWRAHHRLFRYLAKLDRAIILLDMGWLLMIVIEPFATRVLSGAGGFGVRFSFYAVVQVITMLISLAMGRHVTTHNLQRPQAPAATTPEAEIGVLVVMALFAVSIPLAFVTQWAYLCWVVSPLAARRAQWFYRRLQAGHEAS
jgi:uncharacterized membrane protein